MARKDSKPAQDVKANPEQPVLKPLPKVAAPDAKPAQATHPEVSEAQRRQMDRAIDAQNRAQAAWNGINALLAKHRCRIVTRINAEPVGDGSKSLLDATWGVMPNME